MKATRTEILIALRDYLENAPPVLSPDGHYMHSMDGRPIVLDVALAWEMLDRLEGRRRSP